MRLAILFPYLCALKSLAGNREIMLAQESGVWVLAMRTAGLRCLRQDTENGGRTKVANQMNGDLAPTHHRKIRILTPGEFFSLQL
jgi:hypothetical protein